MVSVIIPAYNAGKNLIEAMQSVKNQSCSDWECIVVDDGSTDNIQEVVETFLRDDNRFKYIRQDNKGVSAARNAGLKLAKGEFVQFLDADDLLQADKFLTQTVYLQSNPEVDIVYSDFQHFNNKMNVVYLKGEYPKEHKVSFTGQRLVKILLKRNFIRMNTPMLRKSVIEDAGFFNENLISAEDWEFWLRCACRKKIFAFYEKENANALIRINPEGLSKNSVQMKKYYLPVLQNIFTNKKLNFFNKLNLLSRYEMVFIESFLKSNNTILFTDNKKNAFKFLIFSCAVIFFPFYLIIKFFNLIRK